jgi:tRNA threonylcarbamoyladenosine biosynthesis protein TsaB
MILGIDTCGETGSIALVLADGGRLSVLGESSMGGREYSMTLVSKVCELLGLGGMQLGMLRAIVIVNGPGSFTGIRVGVSAAKGLVEGREIGVVPVSRLEVLAAKSGVASAALDARRGEVFLRLAGPEAEARELLAGKDELAQIDPGPKRIAVCDEGAAALLKAVWPEVDLVRVAPPVAADAVRLCAARVAAGEFADIAMLDGHYLRRSDAEIFGEPGAQRSNT